jgi:two-component system, response regulator YesN
MYKVLVIEDERIIREGLILAIPWLKLECEVIAQASDGEEGLRFIQLYKPDIVICDINMPIINGLEMIKRSINDYNYKAIIISGYSEFSYAQEAMKYGIQEYILKPVNHQELSLAIERLTNQLKQRNAYQDLMYSLSNKLNIIEFKGDSEYSWVVRKMIDYVKQNYPKKIIMQDLVDVCKQSATSLHQAFKKETGYTFNQFLNRYRVQIVITEIIKDELPIHEIASKCGYSDIKYFYEVFKKITDHSPSEIKKIVDLSV